MKVKKILLTGCLSLLGLTGIYAQETPAQEATGQEKETLSITLDEAKDYALKYNRTLRSSDLAVQKAEKAKWQSIAAMLPHADATLGYSNYLDYKLPIFGQEVPMPATGELTIQATMAVNGQMIMATRLSEMAKYMAETNKSLTELDVKANVTTGYLSVLIAEESKRLIESSKENIEKLHESTSRMYEVGMAEQTDVDQLTVQMGIIENNVRMTERNIELAYNSLRLLLGSNDAELVLTETLEQFLSSSNAYETAIAPFDVNENYNVKLLDQNIELSKRQLNLSKWEYGPTLSAFYRYYGQEKFSDDEGFNMNPPHVLGATLSIPLFSSGERLSKVQQARFDVQTAKLNKEDAVEGLLVQEKQLRFNLKSAIETYEIQKKNVEVYERIFKNTSQKYELGTVSSTELTTINNNLISAQSTYISALMELFSAQTELQKLLNQF